MACPWLVSLSCSWGSKLMAQWSVSGAFTFQCKHLQIVQAKKFGFLVRIMASSILTLETPISECLSISLVLFVYEQPKTTSILFHISTTFHTDFFRYVFKGKATEGVMSHMCKLYK